MGSRMRRGKPADGFTYFGVIFAVAVIGMSLAVVGFVARTELRREKEVQLLWVGNQYRTAIARYWAENGGRLPQSLSELTQAQLTNGMNRRYLRRLYEDPITGTMDWNLYSLPGGGIYGVSSGSKDVPIKQHNFRSADASFEGVQCYSDWQFLIVSNRFVAGGAKHRC